MNVNTLRATSVGSSASTGALGGSTPSPSSSSASPASSDSAESDSGKCFSGLRALTSVDLEEVVIAAVGWGDKVKA